MTFRRERARVKGFLWGLALTVILLMRFEDANAQGSIGEKTKTFFTQNTQFATRETGDPSDFSLGHSVWWRWTPLYRAETVFTLNSPCSKLDIFRISSSSANSLVEVAHLQKSGDDNWIFPPEPPTSEVFVVEPGETYFFAAENASSVSWAIEQRTLQLESHASKGVVGMPLNLQATWLETNQPLPTIHFFRVGKCCSFGSLDLAQVQEIGAVGAPPYVFEWHPSEPGDYMIFARCTDGFGIMHESQHSEVQVYSAGDNFSQPSLIPPLTTSMDFSFNLLWSSAETNEPPHPDNQSAVRSQWWTWTPSHSAHVRLKATQGTLGLPLEIFVGDDLTRLRLVASNKDKAYRDGLSGAIRLNTVAGTTYLIRVDDTRPSQPIWPNQPLVLPPPGGFVSFAEIHLRIEPVRTPLPGELSVDLLKLVYHKHAALRVVAMAHVLMPDGKPVTGPSFLAQLYASPTINPLRLQPVSPAREFLSSYPGQENSFLGTFYPAVAVIPNAKSGTYVFAEIRVWDSAYGTTYEAARANGGLIGESNLIRVLTGSDETGPMPIRGIRNFKLHSTRVSF